VVTGSKDFYKDGHDYVTPRLWLVGCTLRVRGASLAGRGAYPPGTSTEKNGASSVRSLYDSFLFSFLKMVKKMSKDPDYNYMDDSLPRDSLSEGRGW
jgi:hypothetical protein